MIETKQLLIQPLRYDQLVKYARCDNSLEAELNLNTSNRMITAELQEALENPILPNVADTTRNYLYSTLWTAVSKADNKMIGDLCMMGEPDPEGKIEIGYGTYHEFQGKGYMTELVAGIITWIQSQPNIRAIKASTDKTNIASHRVLEKNNFVKVGETETLFNWELELNSSRPGRIER